MSQDRPSDVATRLKTKPIRSKIFSLHQIVDKDRVLHVVISVPKAQAKSAVRRNTIKRVCRQLIHEKLHHGEYFLRFHGKSFLLPMHSASSQQLKSMLRLDMLALLERCHATM